MKPAEFLAAGVLLFASGAGGHGSTAESKPIVALITKYQVKPAYRESFRKMITGHITQALKTPGNIMAEAYEEQGHEDIVWTIERWKDAGSRVAISGAIHDALAAPEEQISVKDLEPLSKEEWRRKPDPKDHPFTAVLILKTKPGSEEEFKNIYHAAMPKFRGEAGVVTYQLSQNQADESQFITYEKFRSDDAFQFHLKFPPIEPVVRFLQTSIQDPPFEQGLHHLIELTSFNTK